MATLNGTSDNDVIIGTADGDTIEGLAGNDRLEGLEGDDTLRGGDGNDYLLDGEGDDILEGGAGDDSIDASYGDDRIDGGDGNDNLASMYSGHDVISGGAGRDSLIISDFGGVHTTEIDMGADEDFITVTDTNGGNHVIAMGTGDDFIRLSNMNGAARITLGAGRDVVELAQFFWQAAPIGSVVITDFATGDSGDRLELVNLMARLFGNWDHDLNPFATGHARLLQSGAHTLLQFDKDGGGDDYVTLLTLENVSAAALTAENLSGFPSNGTVPAMLTVTGTSGDDSLHGAAGGDAIQGLGGNDKLFGGAGDDLIEGGAGQDIIEGQVGDDEIHGGADYDQIDGGHGTDTIYGEGGNDYITSLQGADFLYGGDENDYIYIGRSNSTVETVTAFGGAGDDQFELNSYGGNILVVDGGTGADSVSVSNLSGVAQVTLGEGADRLLLSSFFVDQLADSGSIVVTDFAPGAGDVLDFTLFAVKAFTSWDGSENPFGAGFMRLVQNGTDTWLQIDRSGGNSTWRTMITFQSVAPSAFTAASLSGYAPDGTPPPGVTLIGTEWNDNLTGGNGNDTIEGLDNWDFLHGAGGSDILRGGAGNDNLYGGTGNDLMEGGDGDDFFDDGSGDDLIFGGEGNDTIYTFGGWDILHGGAGDDYLVLQRSYDDNDEVAIFAEEGNDYLYAALHDESSATADMGSGDDKVDLEPIVGSLSLTLGAGADEVTFSQFNYYQGGGNIELTDFTVGADTLSMLHFLEVNLDGWDPATNPFETGGYARLVKDGADTVLQIDTNGAGDNYQTVITLLGVDPETLGVASIGYDTHARFGGNGDETWTYASPAALAGLTFDGGGGTDRLVLNGQFAGGLAFGTGTLRNMERIELISATAGGFNSYNIAIADNNVFPTSLLTVAGGGLRAGESLTFDAGAATAGRFAVTAGAGDDTVLGGGGDDALIGGAGTDQLRGNAGNDMLDGGAGTDQLRGNAGNDVLDGGAGADDMAGGTGNDVYYVDNEGDIFTEGAGEGTDEIRYGLANYSLVGTNFENLSAASDIAHDFRGNAGNNVITGGAGNDVLRLYDGGSDTVNAGAGNDNIFFIGALSAADLVNGGAGVDTLVVQGNYAGGLTLGVNVTQIENVSILGGNNISFGEPGTNRYDYVLTIRDANFAAGVQARINGSALLAGEDFTFNGTAETDASFVVYGGKGKDTLTGGLGNDIFFYAEERFASGDTVNGGAGYDGMFLRGNYTIDFNAPGYTGLFTNIENLTLTSATDERYARGGGTEFDYNLTLSNAIVGAGQELTVSGALLMATETMVLDGSQETDGLLRLFGGKAADTLKGGGQADLLHGNFGADILSGGGGADAFRYQAVTESYSVARDHILDFTPGTDRIELDRIDANEPLGGNQAFTWIGSNAFSNTAGELRAFQSGALWIVEGDVNGDGFADLIIALTLQGPTPLGAGDFIL